MDDTDPCLYKGRTSVLSNPAVIARRKRMEIRRFKKLSRSPQPLHDKLDPVVENSTICIKRARIERATTTGSFFGTLEGDIILPFTCNTEEALDPLCKGKGPANLNDRVLLTHKSLPSRGYCVETDVYAVTSSLSEEQWCKSLQMSTDQEAESGSSLREVVSSPPCGSAPTNMDKGSVKLPCESARDSLAQMAMAPTSMGDGIGKLRSESSRDTLFPPTAISENFSSHSELENALVTSDLVEGRPDAEMVDANNNNLRNPAPEVMSSLRQTTDSTSTIISNGSSFPPSGRLLVCGRRREMEDTVTIAPSFTQLRRGTLGSCSCAGKPEDRLLCDQHFFAVYDGHGGSEASNYCMERLHHALAEELSSLDLASEDDPECSQGSSSSSIWEKAMSSCFSKVDQEVGGVCPNGQCNDVGTGSVACCGDSIAPENVGTTAIVAVVSSCQIVVANCGDSRAVLSRGGEAIPLSRDHKPERDDETSRIEAAGGRVIYWDGYRVGGLLAVSRSIGDRYLKRYVVSEPEVRCLQRTEDDECLILASDGLWNVISSDAACEIARKCLESSRKKRASGILRDGEDPASAAVAALLVKIAYGRGSKDNISVVVIDLKS